MQVPIKVQWEQLCDSVEKLELEIAQTDFPIPTPQMCKLLIVGEDHRFYEHPGVDLFALCRALWKTVFCGVRQGVQQSLCSLSEQSQVVMKKRGGENLLRFFLLSV